MHYCCDIKISENIPACDLVPPIFESLLERVDKMKNNMYTTNEIWNAKNIYIIDTDTWYSYADLDLLFNGSYVRFEK